MSTYYDDLETRDPQERERMLFEALPGQIAHAKSKASGWADLLADVTPEDVTSRAELAKLPVLRKADLAERQRAGEPLAGLTATPISALARLFTSPGPVYEPGGSSHDWWRAARAFFAAGVRPGDIVHNAFAYHLTPGGFIMESGAQALGCPVIPAGVGNAETQVEVIAHYRPAAFAGTPDFLKVLLDKADELGADVSSLAKAVVSGAALPPSLRDELQGRGVAAFQAYVTADLGLIAYESEAMEGMTIDERLIVEIVRPGSGEPVAEGEVGEVVVTNFNRDYPLIRFATGDLSAVLAGASPCGRTNMRIKGWMGRADQRTKVKGMFVDPQQLAAVAERHPELGRLRLVVTREGDQDVMTLQAESASSDGALADQVAETLRTATNLRGGVELVSPDSLPNDGKVIADERSYD